MRNGNARRTLLALALGAIAVRFAVAAIAPIAKDEAYYLAWSRALDFGYFDHPPAVAWLGVTSLLAPSSAFAGRLGGLLVSALTIPFCIGLFRRAGLGETSVLVAAVALSTFNLCGLTCGMLVVPDTLYFVAWCAALHEAAAALDGQPKRWLTAGVATGIGLLSKYMMVLMLPVLFIAAWRKPRELRSLWPWAGVLLALAIFSPHLVWNARNDWIPVRFQLSHGLSGSEAIRVGDSSRWPAMGAAGDAELSLARHFGYDGPAVPPPKEVDAESSSRTLSNVASYVGSVALWWGALIVLVVGWFVNKLRGRGESAPTVAPHVRPLLLASVLVPSLFFGVVSLRSSVESNWPAAYTVGACAFLASYGARHVRLLVVGCALNVAALLLVAVHARSPLFASDHDRVASETHGYRELAEVVASSDEPVFVDRHQSGGLLRFYLPGREITQWPGMTRPSELVRRSEWNVFAHEQHAPRSFLLVCARVLPPGIDGFRAVDVRQVTVRANAGRIETTVTDSRSSPQQTRDTGDALHRWYVIRYVALDAQHG